MNECQPDITLLLRAVAAGDRNDLDVLMTAIYSDIRRLAVKHMSGERNDHTLSPTALVHEAYAKLIDQRDTDWKDRVHFFAIASRIIRRILIDHARSKQADKRGGNAARLSLEDMEIAGPMRDFELIALDEALRDLAEIDERQVRIVEMRFFGGCSIEEIGAILDIGKRTVDRDWQAAKAWLYVRLEGGGHEVGHAG